MTVGEWLDTWQKEYLGNTKAHTKKSYEGIIRNHILPEIGAVKLSALTPIQVQRLINGVKSTKKSSQNQPVNPKTVKNVHGVLHSALNQAVQCGYIRTNPADRTILPKRSKRRSTCWRTSRSWSFSRLFKGNRFEYLYQLGSIYRFAAK